MIPINIDGKSRLMAIIGETNDHIISPQLINLINSTIGYNFCCLPFEIERNELSDKLEALRVLRCFGASIVSPYKELLIKEIDEIDDTAKISKSVNIIKFADDTIYGKNTEVEGFIKFLDTKNINLEDKTIYIIGSGCGTRAVALACAQKKCNYIQIMTSNKNNKYLLELSEYINNNFVCKLELINRNDKESVHSFYSSNVIINATPIGEFPYMGDNPLPKEFNFSKNQIAIDLIYNPIKTKFLVKAEDECIKSFNGIDMFFYSHVFAYKYITGISLDEKTLDKIYKNWNTIIKK